MKYEKGEKIMKYEIGEKIMKYEIGEIYEVSWIPTKYLYGHTGALLRETETTLFLLADDDPNEFVCVQKKFIKSIKITQSY